MPVIIPNTFASATTTIPLSQLDANFGVLASSINAITNGTQTVSALTVTVITGGSASLTGLSVSGNTVLGSASLTGLNVSGTTVLDNVTVSGAVTIDGSLAVSGTSTFDDITASGATFTNVTVSGDIAIGEDLTVSGSTHVREVAEFANIQAVAASGTINLDWNDGGILYLTSTATSNFSINMRGASAITLNSVLATGEAAGFAVVVTQGATGMSQTNFLVDGATASVYWQGGVTATPTTSGLDVLSGTVIKTGNASFVVLESSTKFKRL